MRLLVLGSVVSLVACGALTPPKTDGGSGGGGGALTGGGGGSATGGGGGALTGGGGGSTTGGGGGTTGGGGGGAADAGEVWDFANVTLSPGPVNSGEIVGFAETDAGIYAMSSSSRLYRSNGGAFTQVLAFPSFFPRDFEGSASGQLFALGTVGFYNCAADCENLAAWNMQEITANNEVLDSLCVVDDNHVLAIGAQGSSSNGVSYRWNGTSLATTPTAIGATDTENCWKAASGDFFIPALNSVVRYSPGAQSFSVEPNGTTRGRGGGSSPGHEWVVGYGPVIGERVGSSWTNVFAPMPTVGNLNAVVGISPTLAFAFGGAFSSTGQSTYRFNGTSWAALTPDLPTINVAQTAFRSADGSIFIGGNDGNQYPAIVRGTRR